MKRRCKYGQYCYRKSEKHLATHSHPGDDEWNLQKDKAYTHCSIVNDQGEVKGLIEQGPFVLRWATFGVDGLSLAFALFRCLNVAAKVSPVSYVLDVYMGLFAFTAMLFEAPPTWVQKARVISFWQDMLIQHSPFITISLGRGLFYGFQGTLWLCMQGIGLLEGILALALATVGILQILMHYGVMEDHEVEKAMFCHPGDEWKLQKDGSYSHFAIVNDQGKVKGLIEQGHVVLRCALVGVGGLSLSFALFRCLNVAAKVSPVSFVLDVYMGLFAFTAMLFEAPPTWVQKASMISFWQDMLIQYCPFMTVSLGRGLFYCFQGTLWLCMQGFGLFEGILALALAAVGLLQILMHYGIMPDHKVEKVMEGAEAYGEAVSSKPRP